MVTRQIELDEETDRILARLAVHERKGLGAVVTDLVRAHESLESFADEAEILHAESLQSQKERSERGFAAGLSTPWDQVKFQNGL